MWRILASVSKTDASYSSLASESILMRPLFIQGTALRAVAKAQPDGATGDVAGFGDSRNHGPLRWLNFRKRPAFAGESPGFEKFAAMKLQPFENVGLSSLR